jgi:hypothetical protein
MVQPLRPTDDDAERDKGRVALWLDPADLKWLSQRCDARKTPAKISANVALGFGFVLALRSIKREWPTADLLARPFAHESPILVSPGGHSHASYRTIVTVKPPPHQRGRSDARAPDPAR